MLYSNLKNGSNKTQIVSVSVILLILFMCFSGVTFKSRIVLIDIE